tara:strand:+ start:535 stop:1164 length:630 start_codon:yes stop_codon:yes gene_type:complete
MSISGVIIEKNCSLKNVKFNEVTKELLGKKCGFKKLEDFELQHTFKTKFNKEKYVVEIYGKVNGRANNENKYEYPPPIDNTLFFGNMMVICKINDVYANPDDFNSDVWKKIYTRLFGGFIDLNKSEEQDELEEDELENVPDEMKTKEGYLKDGFIVDDDDDNSEASFEITVEQEGVDLEDSEDELSESSTIDIDSELSEEEYMLYSDDD